MIISVSKIDLKSNNQEKSPNLFPEHLIHEKQGGKKLAFRN
jgi:hypothetical protein